MNVLSGIKILVLDRGHVLVGRIEPHPELAFHWWVSPARTIRRWGTERGLGQLASGPTSNTILDDPTSEAVPFRAVLRIIDVEENQWVGHLQNAASPVPPRPTRTSR